MAVDRFVAAVEDVAAPFAHEHALGGAALVAGVLVDRPPSARGPAHDLDLAWRGIVDEPAVALQRGVGRVDDRHAHAAQSVG